MIDKSTFYKKLEMSLADNYGFSGYFMACNIMEENASEGIDAFIEKCNPNWKCG